MRAVIQRVSAASVSVDGEVIGAIGSGLLVFVGIGQGDADDVARRLAAKIVELRVFEDDAGKMNLNLADVGGAVLCISQFTLYGDVRRGRRPSFAAAAAPELAERLYANFCKAIDGGGVRCERGRFGAHMVVSLTNDGPVTLIIDSDDLNSPRRTAQATLT